MSPKSYLIKLALISCYRYRGVDHRGKTVWDFNANYIETEDYSIRQQRYNLPDIVITKNGIQIYDYCPDPREQPYTVTPLMTLREFLKNRQHVHIERLGDPVSQSVMKEVLRDYLLRAQAHRLKESIGPQEKIDQEKLDAAHDENEIWKRQSITRIDEYIDTVVSG